MVVAGQRDFEVRVSSLDDLDSFAHRFHRTLVHRDSGPLEPSFLAKMLRKVFQEDTPVFGVGFLARFSIEELYAVGRLVVVVERQCPRYHRVATDLLVDAYSQHKFHPAVEHRIIISPSPVYLLDAGNHAVEMVFSLSRPRLVHDAGGDGFLSGIGQHLHNRAHQFEMFLTPQRYVVVTSYSIRILPQIEMELPVPGSRERPVHHLHLHLQLLGLHPFSRQCQSSLIFPGRCLGRNLNFQPNRLDTASSNIPYLNNIYRVGHQRRIPLRLVGSFAATTLSVFIQLVCHHVANKTRCQRRSRYHIFPLSQVRYLQPGLFDIRIRVKERLGMDAFPFPTCPAPRFLRADIRNGMLRIADIDGSPGKMVPFHLCSPSFRRIARLRVG